jgi:hypothetical protein
LGTFKANLIAWFADTANGIGDFFARRGHFREQMCVGDTCVTPDQFAEVFGNQTAGAAGTPGAGSPPEAPAATSAQEGSDTDAASTTTPNVSEKQPTSEDTSEPAELGASEAPKLELEPDLAPANDNQVLDPLPATGTE